MKNIGQILDIHNFDSLAYGINNLTGNVLDDCIELISKNLQAIQVNASDIPLVLQNDVSIPVEVVQKVINIGVSKINVNTECQFSFAYATRKYIEANKDQQGKGYDLRKLFAPGLEEIKITVGEKMEIFRSAGKA